MTQSQATFALADTALQTDERMELADARPSAPVRAPTRSPAKGTAEPEGMICLNDGAPASRKLLIPIYSNQASPYCDSCIAVDPDRSADRAGLRSAKDAASERVANNHADESPSAQTAQRVQAVGDVLAHVDGQMSAGEAAYVESVGSAVDDLSKQYAWIKAAERDWLPECRAAFRKFCDDYEAAMALEQDMAF